MRKHLWEIEHSYYCNEGNYYAPGREQPGSEWKSWTDFYNEFKDADFDYNYLIHFDWDESDDGGNNTYKGDDNYRNGKLKIFWLAQRKGLYRWDIIEVCRNDEENIKEFLKPRWEYIKELWEPIS